MITFTSAVLGSRANRRIDPIADGKFHALVWRQGLLIEAETSRLVKIFPYFFRCDIVKRHAGDRLVGHICSMIESNLLIAQVQGNLAAGLAQMSMAGPDWYQR